MGLFRFLGRRLIAMLSTLVMLALVAGVFLGYRVYFGPQQQDDSLRLANKARYLDSLSNAGEAVRRQPNILFVLYDDLGYGDIGFGARGNAIDTPHLDALARNGVMLSDFHSPAPVCTPSRAGYLTGRLAPRAGLPNVVFPTGSTKELIASRLLNPTANLRLPAEEITLAEILKATGYRTGMVGKWHLGDRSPSLPNDLGFDSFYGALYSNDMEPFAFYRNGTVDLPAPVDQARMSEIYTREAIEFISKPSESPFFLYFAHNFPHDPLSVRSERAGNSDAGLYGDVLEELDEGIGELVAALRQSGQLDNTLIVITSDNGPWYLGNAGDQRGRKGNTFEGGMRVPFIAHWPARISGGRVEDAMAMGIDLVPTVLDLLELPGPPDRALDGKSLLRLLSHGGESPHEYLHYYDGNTLFATRDQRFKYRGAAGVFYSTDEMPVGGAVPQKEWLFDLQKDPRESYDTSTRHPQKLVELREAFERKRAEMEANLRGWH